MALNAVLVNSLPQFLSVWVEEGHFSIYIPSQFKTWYHNILKKCPCFLDCPLTFIQLGRNWKDLNGVLDTEDMPEQMIDDSD